MTTPIGRYHAAAVHLGISATIATLVFVVIYFLWFPAPLFQSAGGRDLFFIVLAVDVTIGPLVTLIVFVPGKKGLVFDLWVIGILQSAALAFGVWTLAEARPVYIAFVKDRFEIARANQIPGSVLAEAGMNRYLDLPWTGPRIVGVRFPTDADEKFKLMISGMGGVDIQCYPNYHVPYAAVRNEVAARGAPLAALAKFNKGISTAAIASRLGRRETDIKFLPMRLGKVDLAVLVDATSGEIIEFAELKPWEYE